jgi:hypothetical protein
MLCSSVNAQGYPDPPVSSVFGYEMNAEGDTHYYPSLAFDPMTGQPCAAYAEQGDDLVYSCVHKTYWVDQIQVRPHEAADVSILMSSDEIFRPSLAFNPLTKKPGIAYQYFNSSDSANYVFYAFQDGDDPFDVDDWNVELVDQNYFFNTEHADVSLAFKSDGTPCIVYHEFVPNLSVPPGEMYVSYACRNGFEDWTIEDDLPGTTDSVLNGSLAMIFDDSDNPWISYGYASIYPNGAPVQRILYQGSSWDYIDVDGEGIGSPPYNFIEYPSGTDIAFSLDGNLCITYSRHEDPSNIYQLVLACKDDSDNWNLEVIANQNDYPNVQTYERPNLIFFDNSFIFEAPLVTYGDAYVIWHNSDVYVTYLEIDPTPSENWVTSNLEYWEGGGIGTSDGLSAALHGPYIWTATAWSGASVYAWGPKWAPPWTNIDFFIDQEIDTTDGFSPHLIWDDNGYGRAVYLQSAGIDPYIHYNQQELISGPGSPKVWSDPPYPQEVHSLRTFDLDVAWDAELNPHMSSAVDFTQIGNPAFYYSYWDEGADAWENEPVGPTANYPYGTVLGLTAIALNSQENPCIAYSQRGSGEPYSELYYTCRVNDLWSDPEPIDLITGNLSAIDLVFRENDQPCVSYQKWFEFDDPEVTVKCRGSTGWDVDPEFTDVADETDPGLAGYYSDLEVGSGLRLVYSNVKPDRCDTQPTTYYAAEDTNWEIEPIFPIYNPFGGEWCWDMVGPIDFLVGSPNHVVVEHRDDPWAFYSTDARDGEWQWNIINTDLYAEDLRYLIPPGRIGDLDLRCTGMSSHEGEPRVAVVAPGFSLYYVFPFDKDNDGLADDFDPLISPGTISGYDVEVEGAESPFDFIIGERTITFGPVSFDWNFQIEPDGNSLDLSQASINEGEGFIEVHGITQEIPGGKTVRLDSGGWRFSLYFGRAWCFSGRDH